MYFFADFGADYRVVSTDYTTYAIIYSCTPFAGKIKVSEASWVLTRDPIAEGSAAYTAMMDLVDPIYKDKIPYYDKESRMRTTEQGGSCVYSTY